MIFETEGDALNGNNTGFNLYNRILVVDANETTRDTLVKALQMEDYKVAELLNSKTTLDKLIQFRPNVAILDMQTAKDPGLIDQIHEFDKNIMIFMISSRIGHGDFKSYRSLDKVSAYFMRPIHGDELNETILDVLKGLPGERTGSSSGCLLS